MIKLSFLQVLGFIWLFFPIFQLYVWDDSKYLPISVTNKAAELLFGNISAEKVHSSYTRFNKDHYPEVHARKEVGNCHLPCTDKILRTKEKEGGDQKTNFHMIWLILLKMLFQHEKNSPFRFKVTIDTNRDWENGRLQMVSVSLPAFTGIP